MLLNQVLRMGVGFFLGTWMARKLGPSDFGILSTGLAWAAIAYPFMELGMRQVVIKEMSRRPQLRAVISGTVFRLWLALGCGVAMLMTVWNFFAGTPLPWPVFCAAMLPLTLSAFTVHHSWAEATQRADVVAQNGMWGAGSAALLRLAFLLWLPNLTALAWAIAAESLILFALAAWTGHRLQGAWWPRGWNSRVAGYFLSRGAVLLLGHFGLVLLLRVDAVMVERMSGRSEAGIYAAATRLSELFYFTCPMVVTLLLPKLAAVQRTNEARFRELVTRGCQIMAMLGIGSAIVMLCGGKLGVQILYGSDYERAVGVLMLHSCAALPYFLAEWRYAVLVAMDRAGLNAAVSWLAAVINVVLNLLWIPQHGAIGAASATLVAYIVGGPLATWLLPEMRWLARAQRDALFSPFIWMTRPIKSWQRARELFPRAPHSEA